jgi:hypothetical protein
MARPLIIRRPILMLQPVDDAGAPSGAAVDVSSDVRSVELSPDQSIDTVSTFAGTFTTAADTTVGCTVEGILSVDSRTTWPTLAGLPVEVQIFDRQDSTEYRSFQSEVPFDPSLYGTDDAEASTREWSMELPVLSDVTWVTVAAP